MQLAKSGQIQNICGPNALMTLMEFILDYGDEEILLQGQNVIYREANKISRPEIKDVVLKNLERIKSGERDLFF